MILRVVQKAKERIRIRHQEETLREDREVEAILQTGEILEEGEILETPEEGEILEETLQTTIEGVIASLGKNQKSSMEIRPK